MSAKTPRLEHLTSELRKLAIDYSDIGKKARAMFPHLFGGARPAGMSAEGLAYKKAIEEGQKNALRGGLAGALLGGASQYAGSIRQEHISPREAKQWFDEVPEDRIEMYTPSMRERVGAALNSLLPGAIVGGVGTLLIKKDPRLASILLGAGIGAGTLAGARLKSSGEREGIKLTEEELKSRARQNALLGALAGAGAGAAYPAFRGVGLALMAQGKAAENVVRDTMGGKLILNSPEDVGTLLSKINERLTKATPLSDVDILAKEFGDAENVKREVSQYFHPDRLSHSDMTQEQIDAISKAYSEFISKL